MGKKLVPRAKPQAKDLSYGKKVNIPLTQA